MSQRIAYFTDVEGRWDKLVAFAEGSADVSLDGDAIRLADDVTLVFGGDAVDRGPHARRFVRTLLDAKRRYGDRVVLLAGNRDINKMRLARELRGAPPRGAPADVSRGELLRWIFARTMGAKDAFAHRAVELGTTDDEAVVESFLADVENDGDLARYLAAARLGFRAGHTLFLHGGVTAENFGAVPGAAGRAASVDAWIAALDAFHTREIDAFLSGAEPRALLAYQAPLPGTRANQESVVYARAADDDGNPRLPSAEVIARLEASGIRRLVVGHTPSGDCPAIARDGDFELVLADNSYGRIERGVRVVLTDDAVEVVATTELDDGVRASVRFTRHAGDDTPLGMRDAESGELVKARLEDGDFLLFRGLPEHRVRQVRARELGTRRFVVPR